MLLPWHLVEFWYYESFIVLVRTWRNLLFLIEEDMAVGLMWRLLFVPLFHDPSFVGRILSFIFRVVRIVSGLVTLLVASFFMLVIALAWFALPVVFVLSFFFPQMPILGVLMHDQLVWLNHLCWVGMIFGAGLFVNHLLHHPIKKTWQIKSADEIWQATKLKKTDLEFDKLIQYPEVKKLLTLMEFSEKLTADTKLDQSELINHAYHYAKQLNAPHIGAAYFFIASLKMMPHLQPILLKQQVTIDDFLNAQKQIEETNVAWRKSFIWDDDFHVRHLKGTNRGWLGAPTPALNAISTDLTVQATYANFEDFVGRQVVVSQLVAVLSQETDRNALLVGDAGVGKSTLVHSLAKMIVQGDAPGVLATKRLVKLEPSKLLASVQTEGDMASKIKAAFEEVQTIGDVIVFIDEIHELGLGDAGKSFNIYSLLTPYLESNTFQFIASTESGNYARIVEKEGSLARLFHKIEVPEASADDTLAILRIRAIELQMHQRIVTTFPALKLLTEKAKQFVHDRKLPDSALYLFDECKTRAIGRVINQAVVKSVLSQKIDLPVVDFDNTHKEMLLNLEQIIHQKMIDQEQAVKSVADTLRRAATALRETNRPIGSFLFVG